MNAAAGYFRSLKRRLNCPKEIRRHFLEKTRRTAEDFLQNKPDASPRDLAGYLGEPEELARGFLETLDPEMLGRYRNRKKFLQRVCIAVLMAALIAVTCLAVKLWREPMNVEVTGVIKIYE